MQYKTKTKDQKQKNKIEIIRIIEKKIKLDQKLLSKRKRKLKKLLIVIR